MKDRGFEVMAFPINSFGLDKGRGDAVTRAARDKFDAKFPIFERVEPNG
jgi:glutathione peroxidase-family protein